MSTFVAGPPSTEYDPSLRNRRERDQRAEFDTGLGDFFDPAVDQHSAFYFAMERDKHAAHLVAGTSFLDLNNVILKTECNNAYESMNEEDMQKLRKLMWDVYVPHIQQQMEQKVLDKENATDSFQAQMYVVHLSVRVAQALQLVFELNQKKSFSAVVKTAYEMALQDVLYHPSLKGKIKSFQYKELVNYLRRHETYSTAFNTYVGYKLLRQQLVRSGGAGTNRKSNDAERLHDEAANRLWGVLEENRGLFNDFTNALKPYTMEWHTLYYKEIAETLFHKLADHHVSSKHGTTHHMSGTERDSLRENAENQLRGHQEALAPQSYHSAASSPTGINSTIAGTGPTAGTGPNAGNRWGTKITTRGKSTTKDNSGSGGSSSTFSASGVDIVSAFQETRDAVAGGTSKRSSATVTNPILSLSPFNSPAAKRQRGVVDDANSTQIIGGVVSTPAPRVRGAFGSLFKSSTVSRPRDRNKYTCYVSMRFYQDTPAATNPNIRDNKTLYDLACWKPGRESSSVAVQVREYAEQLIEDGADVNTVYGLCGETALIAASRRSYHSFMEFLLSRGASPYARLNNGNTSLHLCAARADTYGVTILASHHELQSSRNQRGWDPLVMSFMAPEEHRLEILQHLLNANMQVNPGYTYPKCESVLHHALGPTLMHRNAVTTDASREIVNLLLHYGADVCQIDGRMEPMTCLHVVAGLRDRKMLYTLLSSAYEGNSGRLNPPRMPLLEDVGRRSRYSAEEYTAYVAIINEPSRTSLLFVVLRCIEMMKRSLVFALGVRRTGTSMHGISPEIVSAITSQNINNIVDVITDNGLGPWRRRDIEEIAMTALGWMHDTPLAPTRRWWSRD
ncbi:hypothetical protein T484DRAFT_1756189 [Baffinella frigidus]|nr:hypothetical protein T484DRAFT_1756189 [Cryptophyta sp. CCMP2293]